MSRAWLCTLLFPALLAAQAPPSYQFAIDQDNLSGAADFSFLNQPLTPQDRLFVRDGHFFKLGADLAPNTADDQRVRLYGVNLAFSANFPTLDDAPRIARRLRKLGINLVRFHHMDSSPDSNPANANSILTTGPYPTFNETSVARLRAFLQALGREGIYANINLHVGYTFRPAIDQTPAHPAFPSQSKPLHMLHPRLIELQARFVSELFLRLDLRGDPVLALAELNNETSLLYAHQNGSLETQTTGDYKKELEAAWNRFLHSRYATDDALRQAWQQGAPAGDDLLPAAWNPLEIHAGASATLTKVDDATVRVSIPTAAPAGAPIVILKKTGFSLETSQDYQAELEIRAGSACSVYMDVKQDVSPWRTQSSKTINVTSDWQAVKLAFTASFAIDKAGRLGLSLEKCTAPVEVRNARLTLAPRRGWSPEETLAQANYALPLNSETSTEARSNDYIDLLTSLDRAYNQALLAAVRQTNDPLLPVTGTQMGFGGAMLADAQQDLDFFDEHFYIDHYNFPNTAWDGRDWRFKDESSLGQLWSTFLDVAAARPASRPYTVSEYNQPWPNTKGAEIGPTLAAFAAHQDWDALVHFAYEHSRSWDSGVPHGFNLNGDLAKLVNTGQSALLFRAGLVSPAHWTVNITVPEDDRRRFTRQRRNGNFSTAWNAYYAYQPIAAFRHKVQFDPNSIPDPLPPSALAPPADLEINDTAQLIFDRAAARILLDAPSAAGLFGDWKSAWAAAGPLHVVLNEEARGFASILLTALDAKPLAESKRMLLTAPGAALRTQPNSNPARPQNIVAYPNQTTYFTLEPDLATKPSGNLNDGSKPVWMEPVPAEITLKLPGPIEVWALDGAGARAARIPAENTPNGWRFSIGAPAPWYEITTESGTAQ